MGKSFPWPFLHLEDRELFKWLEVERKLGPDNSSSSQDLDISNGGDTAVWGKWGNFVLHSFHRTYTQGKEGVAESVKTQLYR